jgi:hypothetical protein
MSNPEYEYEEDGGERSLELEAKGGRIHVAAYQCGFAEDSMVFLEIPPDEAAALGRWLISAAATFSEK